jgi:Fur family ferric uptake transcriptional regulator
MNSRVEERCIAQGVRMTDQRRTIAKVLSESTDHPDVDQVHARAVKLDPETSITTVYRTLRLFEEAGVLEKHDFRQRRFRYEEATDQPHDHLIDVKTGAVLEFYAPEIEKILEEHAKTLGYQLIDRRLELYAIPLTKDA